MTSPSDSLESYDVLINEFPTLRDRRHAFVEAFSRSTEWFYDVQQIEHRVLADEQHQLESILKYILQLHQFISNHTKSLDSSETTDTASQICCDSQQSDSLLSPRTSKVLELMSVVTSLKELPS